MRSKTLVLMLLRLMQPIIGLRFAEGDHVECHVENDAWVPGTVAQLHVEHEGGTAPFAVRLDSGDTVIAPVDDDRYIRAVGAARLSRPGGVSARLLRFAVGMRVECNLGMYWERGRIVKLNYHDPRDLSAPPVPYEVQLDSGGLVSAPKDDDEVIRREGSIRMSDPSLRFGVGDRIECAFAAADGNSRWEPGRVVALHYHESRFGEGVAMPYQVRLDAEGRLIFVREDDSASIRRGGQAAPGSSTSRSKISSGSKLAKAKVGRQASTIGLHSAGKLGGKYGAGPQRARHPLEPDTQRARQNNFVAWNAAGRPVEPTGASGSVDPLAQWKAVTGRV